jgi:hypothetical protein
MQLGRYYLLYTSDAFFDSCQMQKEICYLHTRHMFVGKLSANFDLSILKCLNQLYTVILSDGSNMIMGEH